MKKVIVFLVLLTLIVTISKSFSGIMRTLDSNVATNQTTLHCATDSLYHTGDIIFRDGRGVFSEAFKKFSLTKPLYSHSGVIHRENKNTYVYHVIGGESNLPGTMRKDLIKDFINPLQATDYAVYRFDLDSAKIDSLAKVYFLKKITFDSKFNLASDDQMYCTEMVYKILVKASGQDNFIPLTTFSGLKYVACDNIFMSPHCRLIYSTKNKKSE